MRRFFLVLICSLAAGVAHAQERLAPNADIESTIQNQLEAFLLDDVEAAWQFASPNIQRLFRTPENFGRMVEGGYPMVWRPADVEFVDLQALGGVTVQRVQVIDRAGRAHILAYQMIETEAGWLINGVQLLRALGIGV